MYYNDIALSKKGTVPTNKTTTKGGRKKGVFVPKHYDGGGSDDGDDDDDAPAKQSALFLPPHSLSPSVPPLFCSLFLLR